MRRNILQAFAFAVATTVLLSVAAPARAQSINLPATIYRPQGYPIRGSAQLPLWINYADCLANVPLQFNITFGGGYTTTSGFILQVWAGAGACTDPTTRTGTDPTCWLVYSNTPANATSDTIYLNAQDIVGQDIIASATAPINVPHKPDNTACDNANGAHVSLVLDFMFVDGTNTVQGTDAQWTQTGYDITPPAPPSAITAGPGDTRIHLDWTSPADPDIVQYQIYCNPPQGPVLLPDAGLSTAGPPPLGTLALLSDAEIHAIGGGTGGSSSIITPVVSTTLDGGSTINIGDLIAESCDPNSVLTPGGFPNEKFRCGTAGKTSLNGVATDLVDGISYEVAVSAVDTVGNIGRLSSNVCQSPEKLIDFFQLYRADGGQGGGGICSISRPRSGSAPAWLIPLATAFIGLGAARRLLRRRS